MDPKGSQELQRTLTRLEYGKRQMESLSKQNQLVESALIEVNATIQALNSLNEVKEGTEMLVTLGANTFVKALLKGKDSIIVGVGGGLSVEKKRGEAVKSLESRKDELTRTLGNIQKMSAELETKLMELNETAENMIGRGRK